MKSFWIINGEKVNSLHSYKLVVANFYDRSKRYKMADRVDSMVRLSFYREFWIREYGESEDADGDVGDLNHEMIAENFLLGELDLDFYNYSEDTLTLDYARHLFDDIIEDAASGESGQPNHIPEYVDRLKKLFGDNWQDRADFGEFLEFKKNFLDDDQLEKQNLIIEEGLKDPVSFVIKHYGWIRAVVSSSFATFQLRNYDDQKSKYIENLLKDNLLKEQYPEPIFYDDIDIEEYNINIETFFPRSSIRLKLDELDFMKEKLKEGRGLMEPVSYPSMKTPDMPSFYKGREGD